MSSYAYEAVDTCGERIRGTLDVATQSEALRRVKDMGLFPTKIAERSGTKRNPPDVRSRLGKLRSLEITIPGFRRRVKSRTLAIFTRQLSTLVEAGMPLLRGLRTLHEQEQNPVLKRAILEVADSIESGSSLSEALTRFPGLFNHLYVNMVRAGELGGVLDVTLRRLTDFMEKAERIKGRVKSAMFYPIAVLFIAAGIIALMLLFVVPRFQQVFEGIAGSAKMPAITQLLLDISSLVRVHAIAAAATGAFVIVGLTFALRTKLGRRIADRAKLKMPILGPVFVKVAIARFSRTLGTLLNSGVPILQALTIVRETAGNVVVGDVVAKVHDSVRQGDTIAIPLKSANVFPAMVAGMVDIGEQTGALPDMLMKIADNYDEDVDNAVAGMTSLLEPLLIVFLAVVVGGIVFAMFMPIIGIIEGLQQDPGNSVGD